MSWLNLELVTIIWDDFLILLFYKNIWRARHTNFRNLFFLIIFSRRHSCPPEQRVRTLAEGEEEKLYESLNPMNEMQSDSDEMAPEDGKCFKNSISFLDINGKIIC